MVGPTRTWEAGAAGAGFIAYTQSHSQELLGAGWVVPLYSQKKKNQLTSVLGSLSVLVTVLLLPRDTVPKAALLNPPPRQKSTCLCLLIAEIKGISLHGQARGI